MGIYDAQQAQKEDNKESDFVSSDDESLLNVVAPKGARKAKNCPFLVLNVIFSHDFAERFGQLGNPIHKDILTAGKALYPEELFWRDVRKSCTYTTMGVPIQQWDTASYNFIVAFLKKQVLIHLCHMT